jgi:hypothetical protein
LDPGLSIVKVREPAELARVLRSFSQEKVEDYLAEMVEAGTLPLDFAARTLEFYGKDLSGKKQVIADLRAKAGLTPATENPESIPKKRSSREFEQFLLEAMASRLVYRGLEGPEYLLGVQRASEVLGRVLKGGSSTEEEPGEEREVIGHLESCESRFCRAYEDILAATHPQVQFSSSKVAFDKHWAWETTILNQVMGGAIPGSSYKRKAPLEAQGALVALVTQLMWGLVRGPHEVAACVRESLDGKRRLSFTLCKIPDTSESRQEFEKTYQSVLNCGRLGDSWDSFWRLGDSWDFLPPEKAFPLALTPVEDVTQDLLEKTQSDVQTETLRFFRVRPEEVSSALTADVLRGDLHKAFAARVLAAYGELGPKIEKAGQDLRSWSPLNFYGGTRLTQEGKSTLKTKENSMSTKEIALNTVTSDLKEIALRTGVKRTRAALTAKMAEFWAKRAVQRNPGESETDYMARATTMRDGAAAFLLSDAGQGVLSYLVGLSWPMLEGQIEDETVKEYGAVVAKEIRIQGGTDLLDGFLVEVVFPMLGVIKDEAANLGKSLMATPAQGVLNNPFTGVRVDPAHPPVHHEDEKDKEIAALKARLAALQTPAEATQDASKTATNRG